MGVSWKRLEKIKLVAYLLYFKLRPEAKLLDSHSRKCKTRKWPCIACNVLFVTSVSAKPGFGGSYGWQSNQTLNVPNLPNTKLNMKRKLRKLKPILERHWTTEQK